VTGLIHGATRQEVVTWPAVYDVAAEPSPEIICSTKTRSLGMEPERLEYKGHRIELRPREGREEVRAREAERAEDLELRDLELLIDEQPVRFGQLPDGQYALEEYAFDWTDDLTELARRYIDYRDRAEEIRRKAESGEEN
jgi:hypothetical protein